MTYQLAIVRPGSLAPGIHQEITEEQRSNILKLLETKIDAPTFHWLMDGEFDYDNPAGAGEDVEASRG